MYQWLQKSQSLSGASSDVLSEWRQFAQDVRYLIIGGQMTTTQQMIYLWVKGLDPISAVF